MENNIPGAVDEDELYGRCGMRNLLVISSRYPHEHDSTSHVFVKSQVNILKHSFDKIVIISTTPYVPKAIAGMMAKKRKSDSLAEDYVYDNVEVYFTKDLVLPKQGFKKSRLDNVYKKSLDILNNINFKPDMIHAHFILPSGYVAMRLKNSLNIPYLITAHGYDVYDLPFRNDDNRKIAEEILSKADHIITVSHSNRSILAGELGADESMITVIPNGYNEDLFKLSDKEEARRKLKLPLDKKIIITIGNSQYMDTEDGRIEVKGHKYYYLAAEIVAEKVGYDNLLFGIIGEVPESEFTISESIEERFTLFGKKNHLDIPLWLNACDIFVMPSLQEGVPTVIFEALGCGKPVIGTNVGGIPDIINNPDVGILIEPGNSEALTRAIIESLNRSWDEKLIHEYSKNFTWENISRDILSVYDKILNNQKGNYGKENEEGS